MSFLIYVFFPQAFFYFFQFLQCCDRFICITLILCNLHWFLIEHSHFKSILISYEIFYWRLSYLILHYSFAHFWPLIFLFHAASFLALMIFLVIVEWIAFNHPLFPVSPFLNALPLKYFFLSRTLQGGVHLLALALHTSRSGLI